MKGVERPDILVLEKSLHGREYKSIEFELTLGVVDWVCHSLFLAKTRPEVYSSDYSISLLYFVNKYQPMIFSQSFSVFQFRSVKFSLSLLFRQLVLVC